MSKFDIIIDIGEQHIYCAEVFSSPMVFEVSELASIIQRCLPISRQRKFPRQGISTLCVNSGADVETLIVKFNLRCLLLRILAATQLLPATGCVPSVGLWSRVSADTRAFKERSVFPLCHGAIVLLQAYWSICVAPLNVKIIDPIFLHERGAAADLLFSYLKDQCWSQRKDRPPSERAEHCTRRLDASTGGRTVRQSPQRRHSNWSPCARSSELYRFRTVDRDRLS